MPSYPSEAQSGSLPTGNQEYNGNEVPGHQEELALVYVMRIWSQSNHKACTLSSVSVLINITNIYFPSCLYIFFFAKFYMMYTLSCFYCCMDVFVLSHRAWWLGGWWHPYLGWLIWVDRIALARDQIRGYVKPIGLLGQEPTFHILLV